MKIIKNSFILTYILILFIMLFSISINKSKKNKSNRKLNKVFLYSTNNSKDVNIKSLKLNGNSHLIAKCPEQTILIKLIFEKNIKSNKIDIGFNCRSEQDIIGIEKNENIIKTQDLDNITPVIECKNNSLLSGIEFERNNDKINFIWYCAKLRKLSTTEVKKTQLLINEKKNLNIANAKEQLFDDKKFSEFLVHTDIKVDNTQKQGIKYIKFNRKDDNSLTYEFGLIDL